MPGIVHVCKARTCGHIYGDTPSGKAPYHNGVVIVRLRQRKIVRRLVNNGWGDSTTTTDALLIESIWDMKGRDNDRAKQTSRGNSWHVKQHGNGQWAVYDPNSKFRHLRHQGRGAGVGGQAAGNEGEHERYSGVHQPARAGSTGK